MPKKAAATTDQRTLDLIKEVQKQKAEIAKVDRPNYKTNGSFAYVEGKSDVIALRVESDVKKLICIASFLKDKEASYSQVAQELGVDAPAFTWNGFSTADWLEDIKLRIGKIQIATKRAKLEALEERLNKIISPELRAEMELAAIADSLK
jgi:hypothetical protein